MEDCSTSDSSESDSDSDSYSSISSDQCDYENGFTMINETSCRCSGSNSEETGTLQTIISSISDASSQCSGSNKEVSGTLQAISDASINSEGSRTISSLIASKGESGIISSISDTSSQCSCPNKEGSGTLQVIRDSPNAGCSPIQCSNFDGEPRTIQCSTISDSGIVSEGCRTNSGIDKASRTFYKASEKSNNGCSCSQWSSPNAGGSRAIRYNSGPNKGSGTSQDSSPLEGSRTIHAPSNIPLVGGTPIQCPSQNEESSTTQFSCQHVGSNKFHAISNSPTKGYSLIHASSDSPNLGTETMRCGACMGPGIGTCMGACMGQIAPASMGNGMYTFQSASKVARDKCLSAQHQKCITRKLSDSIPIPESNISSPDKSKLGYVSLDSNLNPHQNILNQNTNANKYSEPSTTLENSTESNNNKTDSSFKAFDLNSNPNEKHLFPDLNLNPASDLNTTIDDNTDSACQSTGNDSGLRPASIMSQEDKLRLYIPQSMRSYSSDSETDSSESSDSSSSSNEDGSSNEEEDLPPLLSPMSLLSPTSHDPLISPTSPTSIISPMSRSPLISPMSHGCLLSPMSPISILQSPLSPCSVIKSPIGESLCLPTLEYDPLLITNYAVTHRLTDS